MDRNESMHLKRKRKNMLGLLKNPWSRSYDLIKVLRNSEGNVETFAKNSVKKVMKKR